MYRSVFVLIIVVLCFLIGFSCASAQTPAGSVDLIYQTSGYTPPFFKGKAVFAHQNQAIFIAIPHIVRGGSEVGAKNLTYTWKKDDVILGDISGPGQDTFFYDGKGVSQTFTIEVEVATQDKTSIVKRAIIVNPANGEVLVYEDNPFLGIQFQKALSGKISLANKEIKLSAFPYFFNGSSKADSRLEYSWQMNGGDITVPNSKTSVNLRNESNQVGESKITLSVQNIKEFLESAQTSFTISLGPR